MSTIIMDVNVEELALIRVMDSRIMSRAPMEASLPSGSMDLMLFLRSSVGSCRSIAEAGGGDEEEDMWR